MNSVSLSHSATLQADIVVLATGYQPLAKTLLPTEDLRVRGAAHLATMKTCWMAAAAVAAPPPLLPKEAGSPAC